MTQAFVFPGQGSQAVGMGAAFINQFAQARQVMEELDHVLGEKLSDLIAEGPLETLTLTHNTQPALLAVSIAVLRVMESELGPIHAFASYAAGHSLGEYTALCAAGVLSFADAVRLVRLRGKAMQDAVPVGKGAMAAVLGLEIDQVEALLEFSTPENMCVIANDNSPGQVVISGHTDAVNTAMIKAQQAGAKRALLLPVSAPFHSPLMQPAADIMAEAFQDVSFYAPKIPVICNITALPSDDPIMIKNLLVQQVTGRVRWRESVENLVRFGVSSFVEIGAGKILTGLNKRIVADGTAFSVNVPDDLKAWN
jgi:[acyl-carrier-protein] S-malonyltransferase